MTALGAGHWAWVAVHLFAAFMSGFLFYRLRAREYAAFFGMSLSLAGLCAASSMVANARQPADAAIGQNLQALAASVAFYANVFFAHVLVRRPGAQVVRVLFAVMLLTSALILAGLAADADHAIVPRVVLPWAHDYHDVRVPLSGTVAGVIGVLFGIWVVRRLWPLRRRTDVRLLIAAFALMLLGWSHDIALRTFEIRGVYLTEQLASIGGIVVSYLLLANFAQTANALEAKTMELRHAYDELRLVQEELVRKEQLAAVGELSAVIAHEVRNPLAVLRNATASLRREKLAAEDRSTLLTVLDEETDRLNRLVRDLLTYARPVDPQVEEVAVEPVLETAVGKARSELTPNSDVSIDVRVGSEVIVVGDRNLLERVFSNVVANAMQAMPGGGTLTVRSEGEELEGSPAVAIIFEDTGEGMDTLVRSRARDPFFTTRPSGTGLGLAIVERIVKAHGGRVDLRSSDQGSTVSVVLPAEALR